MQGGRLVGVVVTALLVTGCVEPAATTTTTTTATTTTTTTSAPPATGGGDVPPCLAGETAFATAGALAAGLLDAPEGDAELVAGLRWTDYGTCERLVVELATAGGAPATEPGGVRAELLRNLGIVRLGLDAKLTATAVAERLVDSALIERVYVVRSSRGSLFVDIHLASAALARASVTRLPAAVVLDLQPGGPDLVSRPARSDLVVVVDPTGDRAEYPLEVSGYSRTFEANVILRLRKANRVDVEEVTTAADYLETWGEFSFQIASGPGGRVEMFVGEDSARDGTEQGVEISLVMG